jgi:hypothetical protein
VTNEQMERYIREWHDIGLIRWYEAEDDHWIYFPRFEKHQVGLRKDREAPSAIPAPPSEPPEKVSEELPSTPDECRSNAGVMPEKIGLIKENLIKENNGASAPPPPEVHEPMTPSETIEPDTPGSRQLFAILDANAKARKQRGPKQFPSLECKRKFIQEAERRLSPVELKKAFERAMQKGIRDITGVVDFTAKWGLSNNGRNQGEIPAEEF